MSSATASLQKAVWQKLSQDPALAARTATGGIVDRLTQKRDLPTVVIAEILTRDWSTATEPGEEHFLSLEAWSDRQGHADVQQMAMMVRDLLHDQPLALAGARLVNLQHVSTRVMREAKTRLHVAVMQFRAVTEQG